MKRLLKSSNTQSHHLTQQERKVSLGQKIGTIVCTDSLRPSVTGSVIPTTIGTPPIPGHTTGDECPRSSGCVLGTGSDRETPPECGS